MTSREFCYWLQGYFEISPETTFELSEAQVTRIRNHLAMVFKHEIDPSMGPKPHQDALSHLHGSDIHGPGTPLPDGVLIRC